MIEIPVAYLDILNLGNLILIPLSIFPLILNYKYYKKTGIFDYLLIAVFFMVWSILLGFSYYYDGIVIFGISIGGLIGQNEILDLIYGGFFIYIHTSLDVLPLAIVAIRAKWGSNLSRIPKLVIALIIIPIILTSLTILFQNGYRVHEHVIPSDLWRIGMFTGRSFYHAIVIYAFLTASYQASSRVNKSRLFWVIASCIWLIEMLYITTLFFILAVFPPTSFDSLIFILPLDIAFLLLLINHIFYPESVLFTQEQIGRAVQAYSKIEEESKVNPNRGILQIKEYIDSLPEDVKKKVIT